MNTTPISIGRCVFMLRKPPDKWLFWMDKLMFFLDNTIVYLYILLCDREMFTVICDDKGLLYCKR